MDELDIITRVLVATLLTGAVGYERESARKPAGLRTHALVGVGAAVFALAGIVGFDGPDESRIAAQVVTGIGFLGAGAIFRQRGEVEGLTTAAGLWAAAAIGLATGAGEYTLAVTATAIVLSVLFGLRAVDEAVQRRLATSPKHVEVQVDSVGRVNTVKKLLERVEVTSTQLAFVRDGQGGGLLTLAVQPSQAAMAVEMLSAVKGVLSCRVVPALEKRRFEDS